MCIRDRNINKKTRTVVIGKTKENVKLDIILGNTILEQVENVFYLGSTMTCENIYGIEIKRRIVLEKQA